MSLRARLKPVMRWAPLAIILVFGAWMRLDQIGNLPPGLYRDEAYYGLDAVGVLSGHPALVFAANNGREGLFIYLLAAGIAAFGQTVFAVRVVAAGVGIATLVAAYLAGRALFSHRVGVLTAGILAGTFWHVALSRVAYRAITLPLFECLALALAVWALRAAGRRQVVLGAGAGLALGLTLYSYTSGQFILPLAGLAGLLVFARRPWPAARRGVVIILAATALTVLPMALWILRHPDLYLARAGQVSILAPEINRGDLLGTLLGNTGKALGMFTLAGDRIWRHNLSLRPVFDGLMGGAFWIGVFAAIWRIVRPAGKSRWPQAFTLLWLGVFLLPTVLAEDTPHFLRGIGALAPACLLAATGLEQALGFASRQGWLMNPFRAVLPVGLPALIATAVLALTANTTRLDYFESYVRQPMTAFWLEAQNTALADQINSDLLTGVSIRLDARLVDDNPALRFLTPGLSRVGVVSAPAPGAGKLPVARLIVDPNHDYAGMRDSQPAGLLSVIEGPQAQGDLDARPRVAWVAFGSTPMADVVTPRADFVGGATLVSASVRPAIFPLTQTEVTLMWRAVTPIREDDAVFAHWVRDGRIMAQADGSPGLGYLPMPVWRPLDTVLDRRMLRVPGGWQTGDQIRVGLYRRSDGVRRAVISGSSGIEDYVVIGQ